MDVGSVEVAVAGIDAASLPVRDHSVGCPVQRARWSPPAGQMLAGPRAGNLPVAEDGALHGDGPTAGRGGDGLADGTWYPAVEAVELRQPGPEKESQR